MDETEADEGFVTTGLEELPVELGRAAAEALRGRRELEAGSFAAIAAAVRRVVGTSFEQEVEVVSWRAVAPARSGGAPALLLAQLDVVDGSVQSDAVTFWIFEGARPDDAPAAVRGEITGTLLPA